MPGAQPRRAPVARTLSTARRGSNVPAGVPGVYRMPRVRTVTAPAADPGRPSLVAGWIQPEDETGFETFSTILFSQYGTSGEGIDLMGVDDWSTGLAVGHDETEFFTRWETNLVIVEPADFSTAFDPGTPPGGYTGYELENPEGEVLRAKLVARLVTTISAGPTTEPFLVKEIAPSTLNPGFDSPYTTRNTPTHPWAGTTVETVIGADDVDFETPYQEFDGNTWIGWQAGASSSINEATIGWPVDYGTLLVGQAISAVQVTYQWRPPRYRWT